MKYLVVLVALFTFANLRAQSTAPTPESITKVGALLTKKGTVVIKEFQELGRFPALYGARMELSELVVYTPGQETQKLKGLKIEITEGGRAERENTSLLDIEEAESLSKALNYLLDVSNKWKKEGRTDYSECIFATKDDFSVGFYHTNDGKQSGFAKSGRVGSASAYFNLTEENITSLKGLVDKGIQGLKSK